MRTVVFIAGAVLMALEMLASRVLAPYFGNSIYVWGSLISVFLASLSVGYVIGGKVSDTNPSRTTLALALFIPGVLTAVLPWVSGPLNEFLSNANLGPRIGPLLAAFTLFFIPGVFLGMVSPFAIKLQVKGLDTVGNTAGALYAISTLGSIVGTLGTSFFLITWLGVRSIMHLLGLLLLLLSAVVAFTARRSAKAVIMLALICVTYGSASANTTVYEKDSLYHHITVVDDAGVRYLKFDASWQSAMLLNAPQKLYFPYTEFFHLGPLLQPSAQNMLLVGLGGGSVPKNFRVNYPTLSMDVVEIDPEVINVAKKYFALKEDAKLRLHTKDGRMFLKQNKTKYDLVFLDAYHADAIPFHLATTEYLKELAGHMAPNGIVVSNVISTVSGPRSKVFRSMMKTYQTVFPKVYAFPIGRLHGQNQDTSLQNIVIVGLKNSKEPDWAAITTRAKAQMKSMKIPSDLLAILSCRITTSIPLADVPVLTDDYAPVDSLIHF